MTAAPNVFDTGLWLRAYPHALAIPPARIGEIEMHLLAQATFRANAQTIADEKHTDHQFWIDRRAASADVERL